VRAALLAGLLAGLATGLGGALLAFFRRLSRAAYDTLLGFSAGVMLAAGSITLLGPALSPSAALRTGGNGVVMVSLGLACGALLVFLLERLVPHLEPHFAPEFAGPGKRLGILLIGAMTLHHLPEGLAIGVAYASQQESLGFIVTVAIALQNVPEGLAVATPLRAAGLSRLRATLWALASGLTQPLGAALGVWFVGIVGRMVPFALALAAGAMIFVASDQLIPESRQRPEAKAPSLGLIAGFLLVAVLTKLFG
jgi:ZIP family zinc transporter